MLLKKVIFFSINILNVTMPVFIFVILGYTEKKLGFISEHNMKFLSKMSYYFALPCLLLKEIISFDFGTIFRLKLVIHNLLVTFIFCILSIGISLAAVKPYQRGAFSMSCFRSNQGYIGLPLAIGFYGEENMPKVAVILGFSSPFVTILSILSLNFLKGSIRPLQEEKNIFKVTVIVDKPLHTYYNYRTFSVIFSHTRK